MSPTTIPFIIGLAGWGLIYTGVLMIVFALASVGFIRHRSVKEWESIIFLTLIALVCLSVGAYALSLSTEWVHDR